MTTSLMPLLAFVLVIGMIPVALWLMKRAGVGGTQTAGVPILDCHYGTSNGKYALKVDQLLSSSNLTWMGTQNAA